MTYYDSSSIPPSQECQLPEPIRPGGDAGIMVVETCSHCNTPFLLVQRMGGEEWLEAEPYWEGCSKFEEEHLSVGES